MRDPESRANADQMSVSSKTESWLNKLSPRHVVRGQCGRVDRDLGKMVGLSLGIDSKPEFSDARFNRLNQFFDQGTLDTSPIGDFVHNDFTMLVQKLLRRSDCFLSSLRYIKNIYQVGVQSQVHNWDRFRNRLTVELRDCRVHFFDSDIRVATATNRIDVAELSRDTIHIKQLVHRAPSAITFAPA